MTAFRLALANVRFPTSPDDSLEIALDAMRKAAEGKSQIVCFPECFIPGYRIGSKSNLPPDGDWLEQAWAQVDALAGELGIFVILGTERIDGESLFITARVTSNHGKCLGFQDKVQLDPSEESTYQAGSQRKVFECNGLRFGIVICHEGWRYPETVRAAARNGAHLVFHPHVEIVEDASYRPNQFADPGNTFHEKAALCRAAENTCYFATVNCALPGSCTTSAVVDPDGELVCHQPYGEEGLLFAEIETERATGLLASRLRT